MVDPKKWVPKRGGRPIHEVYWFDEGGDHLYIVELSADGARKVKEYLARFKETGKIQSWSVREAGDMDYADLMEELREYFE